MIGPIAPANLEEKMKKYSTRPNPPKGQFPQKANEEAWVNFNANSVTPQLAGKGLLIKAQEACCHLARCLDAYASINYRLVGTKCESVEYTEMESLDEALDFCLQRVFLLEKYLCSTIRDINNNPEMPKE